MPLLEAMLKYKRDAVYPFHTPGHKGGRGMEATLKQQVGSDALMLDVSLMSELDDIHAPRSYLAQAQQLAARLYGSDKTFFAVNGTTQAVHTMLMTACRPGDKVLIPRNAHRCVAGGLLLGDLCPVYVLPEFDTEYGINTQVTPATIAEALKRDKDITAVLLTSPNYYGQTADVQAIADIAHEHGAVLLVDEAHGAHLGFGPLVPPSALQCGADAAAQSTHKLLGALTQCSMLHVKGERLDLERAAYVMSLLTTTSPNYLLMASLDAARCQFALLGSQMIESAVAAAEHLREIAWEFEDLRLLDVGCIGKNGVFGFDKTKVTINFRRWGISGAQAAASLRELGIAVELADAANVLFLVTYADVRKDYELALHRIKHVLENLREYRQARTEAPLDFRLPQAEVVLPPRVAFDAPGEAIALTDAVGRICAEQVSFYPPGIPVLLPGELITEQAVDYCQKMLAKGLPVSGPADVLLHKLRVVK